MTDQGPLGRPPRGASVPGGAPCGAGPQLILRSGCARASGTASGTRERDAGGLGSLPAQTGSRETAHAALKIARRPLIYLTRIHAYYLGPL